MNILEHFYKLARGIVSIIFFYLPAAIITIVVIHFTVGSLAGPLKVIWTTEYYKITLSLIALAVAMGNLSFGAARSSEDKKLIEFYFSCGRQLFYAALMIAIAIGLKYSLSIAEEPVLRYMLPPYKLVTQILCYLFFYIGALSLGKALTSLHKKMFLDFRQDIRFKR